VPPIDPEEQRELISAFCTRLALRPDGDAVRARLAQAFVEHHRDLWPFGDPNATPALIEANIDSLLATVERLYSVAIQGFPGSDEFFERMGWLPQLLVKLDKPGMLLDG
jgi:hypothetical protein